MEVEIENVLKKLLNGGIIVIKGVNIMETFWGIHKKTMGGLFGIKSKSLINLMFRFSSYLRARNQFRWIKDKTANFKEIKKVLEIGSGTGATANYWHNKGIHIDGIEPDINLSDVKNVHYTTLEDFKTFNRYDLFFFSHVFEHIKNLDLFFKKISKLKHNDKAMIFAEVPCCDNPKVMEDSKANKFHYNHFTVNSFKETFAKDGYNNIIGWYERNCKSYKIVSDKVPLL